MKTPDVPDNNVGKINGKTPEEIKKGLECCMDYQSCTEYGEPKCPYNDVTKCMEALLSDALAYIQHLESRLAQAERERDAAVLDVEGADDGLCGHCKNMNLAAQCDYSGECYLCDNVNCPCHPENCRWEWRGVCAENSK